MAKMINWNTAEFQKECINVGMDRLEAAANIIANNAKRILQRQIKGPPITRPAKGPEWTERSPGALVATIRVRRKKGDPNRNVWIMAGNKKTWWALQTEYGRGQWKGGRKSFIRPAMQNAPAAIKFVLESGSGETEGY